MMAQLYATKAINPFGSADEQNSLLLSDLLGSFKRYAGNRQTAYDSGSVQSSPTNTSNQWERVVDRAINQVLGKSPTKGANNFVNALDTAFPSKGYGRSTMTVSGGENYGTSGLLAEVSTEQAILYRQVSTNMTDALKVLAGIQYFSPKLDKESVEALRELIRGRINFLVEEFRRADEPRADLVESYLRSLTESTNEFGGKAYLNAAGAAVTIEDEEQVTNFQLFKSYLKTLRDAWAGYYKAERSRRFNSLSVRVDRADRLFWTIAPVVTHLKTVVASNPSSQSMLRQILSNERVAWALDNILSQLNALAELAA
jgi:hypothetical protein